MTLLVVLLAKFLSFILPIVCGIAAFFARDSRPLIALITGVVASAIAAVAQDTFVCAMQYTCRGLNPASLLLGFVAAFVWFAILWLVFRSFRRGARPS